MYAFIHLRGTAASRANRAGGEQLLAADQQVGGLPEGTIQFQDVTLFQRQNLGDANALLRQNQLDGENTTLKAPEHLGSAIGCAALLPVGSLLGKLPQ
jgi:hypothetical protein